VALYGVWLVGCCSSLISVVSVLLLASSTLGDVGPFTGATRCHLCALSILVCSIHILTSLCIRSAIFSFLFFFSLLLVVIAVCNKHTNIAVQSHARDSTSPLLSSSLSSPPSYTHCVTLVQRLRIVTHYHSRTRGYCYCHPSIDHPRHYHPSAIATPT